MAPEVLNNKDKGISDTRRDVYALGILLSKLLKIDRPQDLKAIIEKASNHNKSERYATAASLNDDLQRYLDKRIVKASTRTTVYVMSRFVQRNLPLVLFSFVLVMSLIAGFIAQSIQAHRAEIQAGIAIKQSEKAKQAQKQAQASEQNAITSLKESQRLTQFLTDLFNLSNPEKKRNDAITAEDLINKASDKLLAIEKPSLADAGFMHTISDIYTRMDKLNQAQTLSENSLNVKKALLQENDPVVITEIIQLGLIHRKIGDLGQSENYLKQAIDLLNRNNPIDKSQLAYVHNHLGNLYWQTFQKDKSIREHQQAIKLRIENGESRLLADSYNNIAVIYKRFYQWDLAIKYTQMALKIYQQEYGDRHPYIALIKHNISAYLVHQNKWHEAEKLLLEALSIFTEAYGEKHNNTLNTQFNLAQNYSKRMHFDKAIDTWNLIIENYKSQNKIEKEAKFRSYLGLTLSKAQRHVEALEQLKLSLEISKNISPKQKNFKAKLLSRYARILIATKSFDKAKVSLIQSIKLIEQNDDKYNYERLFVLNILADVYYQENKRTQALETYQEVLEGNNKDDNLNQKEQIKAFLGTGIIMLDKQQYATAEQNFQKALLINKKINSNLHHTTSLILFQMGKLQQQRQNQEAARYLFKQALEIQTLVLPRQHHDLALTKLALETKK